MNEYANYTLADSVDVAGRAERSGLPEAKIRTDVRDLVLAEPLDIARRKAAARYAAGNWPLIVLRGKDGASGGLGRKSYIPSNGRAIGSWWPNSEVGHNREAKAEIKALFPTGARFDTPKPERLLERIIHVATQPGDLVLDCFVGSGTTAAVAQKMGRRWVACELLESNFARYTKPRLTKVVTGQDGGGITVTEHDIDERTYAVEGEAPEEIGSPSDAWQIESALNRASRCLEAPVNLSDAVRTVIRDDRRSEDPYLSPDEARELRRLLAKLPPDVTSSLDFLPLVKKAVISQIKTKRVPTEVNWRGGGGFQLAHLAPACFDYDPDLGLVTLTEHAMDPVASRFRCKRAGLGSGFVGLMLRGGGDSVGLVGVVDGVSGS